MGCLSRVGCLVVVVAAGATAYWWYGDRLPGEVTRASEQVVRASRRAAERMSSADSSRRAARDSVERRLEWFALNTADEASGRATSLGDAPVDTVGDRVRDALRSLRQRTGPAYVTLSAAEAARLFAPALERAVSAGARNPEFAIDGDRVLLRIQVDLRDYAGDGAIARLLGGAFVGREMLRLGGTVAVPKSGVAHLQVQDVALKGIPLPLPLTSSLLRKLRRESRPSGVASSANPDAAASDSLPSNVLAFALPTIVSDLRVRDGRVVLYRATP